MSSDPSNSSNPSASAVDKGVAYFEKLFKLAIGISTFGATITFTLIVIEIREPVIFSLYTVHVLLATSWLLFTVTLGIAIIFTSCFNHVVEKAKVDALNITGKRRWRRIGVAVSTILALPLLGGFSAISFVVMAYVKPVGAIGVCWAFVAAVLWVIVDCYILIKA